MNISYMLQWAARMFADRVAIETPSAERTYREIDRRTNALANALTQLGVAKGDRVGVFLGNQIEYPEAEFAITKAGAVRVPMLVTSSHTEVERMLRLSDATIVFVSAAQLDIAQAACAAVEHDVRIVAVGDSRPGTLEFESLIESCSAEPPKVELAEDDWYALRFTGGTTGIPKGVLMDHGCMVHVVNNMLLDWNVPDHGETVLQIHPLSHAAGKIMYAWWMRGARQVILPAFNFRPEQILNVIERARVTSMFMIPTALYVLLDAPERRRYDTSSLRMIIYGGSPIPVRRITEAVEAFGPILWQIYGCSEAPNVLTTLSAADHVFDPAQPPPARIASAGRIAQGVEVRIVDANGADCSAGEVGEIISRGPHTMDRYWKDDALTAERVRDGWVYTRDLARFDEDGYLYMVDRKDDVIITGGFNVWPAEIEDVLASFQGVAEAGVFGLSDDKWGEAVTAAVVPKPGVVLSAEVLRQFASERLTHYKVPKRIIVRTEPIPKSPVHKPLRRALRDEYTAT